MRLLKLAPAFAAGVALCACATGPVTEIRARFDCDDGQRLLVTFDHKTDSAVIDLGKGRTAVLASRRPDAGVWYAGAGYELRGAGDTLNYSAPDRAATRCLQTR